MKYFYDSIYKVKNLGNIDVIIRCRSIFEAADLAIYLESNWEKISLIPRFEVEFFYNRHYSREVKIRVPLSYKQALNAVLRQYIHYDYDIDKGHRFWLGVPDFGKDTHNGLCWSDSEDIRNLCANKDEASDSISDVTTETYAAETYNVNTLTFKTPDVTGDFKITTPDIRHIIKRVSINEKKRVVAVILKDGTVIRSRCCEDDTWDPEKGIYVCIAKLGFTNGTQMNKWVKKQIKNNEVKNDKKNVA